MESPYFSTRNKFFVFVVIVTLLLFVGINQTKIKKHISLMIEKSETGHENSNKDIPTETLSTTTNISVDGGDVPPDFFDPQGVKITTTNEDVDEQMPSPNMTLTFSDEFQTFSRYVTADGNITCEPGGVGIWQTVYHFCSRTNTGNDEYEIYTDQNFIDYLNSRTATPTTATSPFTIQDGTLIIEAKPADKTITKAAGWWAQYTSGMITTQFSFAQQYGYFEMRAKLPKGKGLWPAFWLLPVDKSWPPEIDAMEAFGEPNIRGEGGITKIHYASHERNKKCGGWVDIGTDITADFHRYGVLWEPDKITYYFDGKAYGSCPGNKDANQPFYMLANLAVGGKTSWPGTPNPDNIWPVYMHIDYIRAYKY